MAHTYRSPYDTMTQLAMNVEWLSKEVAEVSRHSASFVLSFVTALV